jgi:hypothetical protein
LAISALVSAVESNHGSGPAQPLGVSQPMSWSLVTPIRYSMSPQLMASRASMMPLNALAAARASMCGPIEPEPSIANTTSMA